MECVGLDCDSEFTASLWRVDYMIGIDPGGCFNREPVILDVHLMVLSTSTQMAYRKLFAARQARPQPANYAFGEVSCAAGFCCFVAKAFRNSRERFRCTSFSLRRRPNLDLSPFLSDIVDSFVDSTPGLSAMQ